MQLVLASRSPRRLELLKQIHIEALASPVDIPEVRGSDEAPAAYVERLAKEKMLAGIAAHPGKLVLGSDTIGVFNEASPTSREHVLEKPLDREDFFRMMRQLSDNWHSVMTAVAVGCDERFSLKRVDTRVKLAPLDDAFLASYWEAGEASDKAGGYGIQSSFAAYVQRIEGSYTAVMGLPLCATRELIETLRPDFFQASPNSN